MLATFTGVEVIVKSFTEVLVFLVSEKNSAPPASGLAFTVIVTPVAGRFETVTLNGKVGPGEGACTEFTVGDVVAETAA